MAVIDDRAQAAEAGPGCPSQGAPLIDAPLGADPEAFVRGAESGRATLDFLVRGAKCGGCIAKIEGGLKALDGVEAARLNLSTGKLHVAFDPERAAPRAIGRTLEELGYQAQPFDPAEALADDDAYGRKLLRCLGVAGFASANIMLLSVSVWAGHEGEMGEGLRGMMHWISALIALPAAAYAGRPFFASAFEALSKGRANMDVPISLAVFLALGLSIAEAMRGAPHAYFDAAVMLLFFLLIGRWLDHRLRGRARAAARDLLALQAVSVNRIGADGSVRAAPVSEIEPGDLFILAQGERVGVDAAIEEGVSDFDMSLATGESAPVAKRPGETVTAGAINLTKPLRMRAIARAEDSFLAELARLVEAGEQADTAYVRLADRAARLYVPFVHSAALMVFLGWWIFGGDARTAIINAIALLIITCPCALGLAVPAVQVVATGRLFRAGVLVKSGDALERLAAADYAVFDKTGTLTHGAPRLADPLEPLILEAAAQLARASRHPLAQAIAAAAGPGPLAQNVSETPGGGVEGLVGGQPARLGSAGFVGADKHGADLGADAAMETWLRLGDAEPLRIRFESTLRPAAHGVIETMAARGMAAEILSGDREAAVAAVAGDLGVERWRAAASPAQKAERLDELAEQGRHVLMVGDGLNDAPALTRAFVSMSPGSAMEASQNAADFVIQGDSLAPVIEAMDVARLARQRILENFAFATVYNIFAMPIAAAGMVTPLIAALAMSGSSIIVIVNALRLANRNGARGGRALKRNTARPASGVEPAKG